MTSQIFLTLPDKTIFIFVAVSLLFTLSLTAFAVENTADDPYHPPKEIRKPIPMGELTGEVYHFSSWKLIPTKMAEKEELENAVTAMRAIPGVTGLSFGPGVTTPGLDTYNADYAMLETFASMDAVRFYLPHPIHRNTIAVTLDISEPGGGAIYFMPLKMFDTPSASSTPACMHVAWIWLSETEAEHNSKILIEAIKGLGDIPGLTDIKFGPRAPTAWIGPDDTIDCALALFFDSQESAVAAVSHAAYENLQKIMERIGKRHQWYSFITM